MATARSAQPSWPSAQAREFHPGDQTSLDPALPDEGPDHATVGEMAGLLADTRGTMLMGGAVLTATMIGAAVETAFPARVLRSGVPGVINVSLLCGLIFCCLWTMILLALAGRPALNALSELRWRTGAPLEPQARWLTLPPMGTNSQDWAWIGTHLLLGAARRARQRSQLADTWAYATAAYFLAWTTVILLGF